ncbi:MAG: hypothetical protein ACJAZ1_000755 [Yoonia sp.]|jgi:hypothetical protein
MAREPRFDHLPAFGKIRIIVGQSPNHVQFVWQYDCRVDPERQALQAKLGSMTQHVDMAD